VETGNRWGLSASESYVFLHSPKGGFEGAEEAFKTALAELAARGWIATEGKPGKRIRRLVERCQCTARPIESSADALENSVAQRTIKGKEKEQG
jgi:hypothetical protein